MTKNRQCDIIAKLSEKTEAVTFKSESKKFEKISKNLLTTDERCDIITKLSRKRAAKRSLKIEQRREKYKHKVCARTELENF